MPNAFEKDPDSILDYKWDWSSWLDTGDTISTYTITPETGITVDSDENDDDSVTVWLSGGTVGEFYDVTCQIVTTGGRTCDRTIHIAVKER